LRPSQRGGSFRLKRVESPSLQVLGRGEQVEQLSPRALQRALTAWLRACVKDDASRVHLNGGEYVIILPPTTNSFFFQN
jgi:hypothetical protein